VVGIVVRDFEFTKPGAVPVVRIMVVLVEMAVEDMSKHAERLRRDEDRDGDERDNGGSARKHAAKSITAP
jgi:hypothetical protein